MRIGLLPCNYGDGEIGIAFFKNVDNAIAAQENDEEFFDADEVTEIEVPDDFTPPGFWRDED